jgi:hypothetical protein
MITKFKLGAVEWTVEIDNAKMELLNAHGLCDPHTSIITLQNKSQFEERKLEAVELCLYHEVTHAILSLMGEDDLNNNEQFVHQFSLLLHQFEKTKE